MNVKGADPPAGLTVAEPLLPPLHVTFVIAVVAVIELTVTDNKLGELLPQELLAVTEICPEEEPAVTFMLVVVDVPAHPAGKVQV